MFAVVITEKGGAQRRLDFDKTEVTIGRVQGNDIILPKGNVSKRHSRIVLKDNRFIVVDLKSTNGTYVNGRKITSPLVVKAGDKIYIGDFIVTLEEPAGAGAGASPSMGAPPPMGGSPMGGPPMGGPSPMSSSPMGMAPSPMGGPPPMGGGQMGGGQMGSPMGGGMGSPVMAAPLGGPPPLGQHGGHGPPPLAPSPMSSGPMGGPPPMPGPDMGMGRPPARSAPPPPRTMGAPPMGAPAPPPLPRPEPAPSEPPPPMPAGADRFALDEEPADETMAPSPRVVLPSRPSQPQMQRVDGGGPPPPLRQEPQRQEPQRQEPQRQEPQRAEPQRAEPQRAEPPRQEPQRAEPRQEPVRHESRQDMPRQDGGRPDGARSDGGGRPEIGRQDAVHRGDGGRPDVRAEPSRAADLGHSHEFRTIELGPEGLGPLGPLLEEVGVLEIVVEGTTILVDRGNGLTATGQRFTTADSVARVARHLLSRARVVLDAKNPIGEAMLADGTHILAILPPVAVGGALVEVRRVGRPPPSGESLVGLGMLSSDMLQTLRAAIAVRRNVIVSGPSDAGVALLVGALAAMGAPEERLLIVEASTELAVANARAVRLTAGGTNFGDLLTRASRLRADRVVIDGVRGGEAREALVLAASRGGSTILGVRTTPAAGVLDHLEALASLSGGRDGVGALVQAAVHVVVRVVRGGDGVRRVDSVSELVNGSLSELFEHGENGFASTGQAASFLG